MAYPQYKNLLRIMYPMAMPRQERHLPNPIIPIPLQVGQTEIGSGGFFSNIINYLLVMLSAPARLWRETSAILIKNYSTNPRRSQPEKSTTKKTTTHKPQARQSEQNRAR